MKYKTFETINRKNFEGIYESGLDEIMIKHTIEAIYDSSMDDWEQRIKAQQVSNMVYAEELVMEIDSARETLEQYLISKIDSIAEKIMTDKNYSLEAFIDYPKVLSLLKQRIGHAI